MCSVVEVAVDKTKTFCPMAGCEGICSGLPDLAQPTVCQEVKHTLIYSFLKVVVAFNDSLHFSTFHTVYLTLLHLKSDWHLNPPYIITPELLTKVRRTKEKSPTEEALD